MIKKRIGSSTCPKCGPIALIDPARCKVYMPKGLAAPVMMIECEVCDQPFLARIKWEDAYSFDIAGCEVIGFSRRTATKITEEDIDKFMTDFDFHHNEFLGIIESESDIL